MSLRHRADRSVRRFGLGQLGCTLSRTDPSLHRVILRTRRDDAERFDPSTR